MFRIAFVLIAAGALLACATDQNNQNFSEPVQAQAKCPDLARWQAQQLHGSWSVQLPQLGEAGQLTLRRHPEFSASLRGEFLLGGHRSIASGDLEEGEFNLDESRDGKTLFAFWSGQLVAAECGREIRGTVQRLDGAGELGQASPFVLRRRGDEGH